MNNKKVYMADSFINIIPDLKCSFCILQDTNNIDDETILIKLDDGRYKDIIISVANFNFDSSTSSNLNFNYSVVYNPYDKIANQKNFEAIVKNVVKKIVTYAIRNAQNIAKTVTDENSIQKNKSHKKGK